MISVDVHAVVGRYDDQRAGIHPVEQAEYPAKQPVDRFDRAEIAFAFIGAGGVRGVVRGKKMRDRKEREVRVSDHGRDRARHFGRIVLLAAFRRGVVGHPAEQFLVPVEANDAGVEAASLMDWKTVGA